ncbi:unnamed protein product [Diamesa serratosioi]
MSEKKTIPIELPVESSIDKVVVVEDPGKNVKIKPESLAFQTSILDFLPPIKNTSNFSYHLSNYPPRTIKAKIAISEKISIIDMKQVPRKPVKYKILSKFPKKSKTNVNKKEVQIIDDDVVKEVIPVENNFKDQIRIVPEKFPSMTNVDPYLKVNKRHFPQSRTVVEESKLNEVESKNSFSDGLKYFTNQWRCMQKEFLECPKSTNISLREAMTLINEVKNRLTKKTSTIIHESEIRAEREALTSNHRIYPKPSPSSVLDIKAPMKFVPFDSTVKINSDQQQNHEYYEINRLLAVPTFKYKLPAIQRVTARSPSVSTYKEIEKRLPIYNGETYRKNEVKRRSIRKK